jgi:hypothetical protein
MPNVTMSARRSAEQLRPMNSCAIPLGRQRLHRNALQELPGFVPTSAAGATETRAICLVGQQFPVRLVPRKNLPTTVPATGMQARFVRELSSRNAELRREAIRMNFDIKQGSATGCRAGCTTDQPPVAGEQTFVRMAVPIACPARGVGTSPQAGGTIVLAPPGCPCCFCR